MQHVIGDIGSTSGHWAVINADKQVEYIRTSGYNPYSQDEVVLLRALQVLGPYLNGKTRLTYYGTGVASEEVASRIEASLTKYLELSEVDTHSDLIGAARACCGTDAGVVAILGTGSNCAFYDGHKLTHLTPSLGYPVGDEGSGWRIGSAMVQGFYYNLMPDDVCQVFSEHLPDDRSDLLAYLRDSPTPNRYLASFATFAAEHLDASWIRQTVKDCIREFVVKHVVIHSNEYEVHCIGGIAHAFRNILEELLNEYSIKCGRIIGDPLPDLVKYHLEHE